MKRIGTAFLALVMALSCVGPALAVEEGRLEWVGVRLWKEEGA